MAEKLFGTFTSLFRADKSITGQNCYAFQQLEVSTPLETTYTAHTGWQTVLGVIETNFILSSEAFRSIFTANKSGTGLNCFPF